jgi:hypothetical protein
LLQIRRAKTRQAESVAFDDAQDSDDCPHPEDWRRVMVRELQIMTVGLVFLFLGAIVVGVF